METLHFVGYVNIGDFFFFYSFGFVLLLYSVRYDCCVCNWSNRVCKYIHMYYMFLHMSCMYSCCYRCIDCCCCCCSSYAMLNVVRICWYMLQQLLLLQLYLQLQLQLTIYSMYMEYIRLCMQELLTNIYDVLLLYKYYLLNSAKHNWKVITD